MKNIKILKIILFIVAFIIITFILSNSCNASVDISYNNKTLVFTDNILNSRAPNGFVIFDYTPNCALLRLNSDTKLYVGEPEWNSSAQKYFVKLYANQQINYCYLFNYHDENTTRYIDDIYNSSSWSGSTNVIIANLALGDSSTGLKDIAIENLQNVIKYSTVDIYRSQNSNDVVFQPAPMPVTAEIPVITTAEQIPMAITQTLEIVLPVGLVLLAICLVVYLIRSVVYRAQ